MGARDYSLVFGLSFRCSRCWLCRQVVLFVKSSYEVICCLWLGIASLCFAQDVVFGFLPSVTGICWQRPALVCHLVAVGLVATSRQGIRLMQDASSSTEHKKSLLQRFGPS